VGNSKPINKLTDKHRIQIIHWLAEFISVKEIVQRIKAQFDIEITEEAIHYYAPPNVPDKWREEFDRHRAAYLADIDSIGLRHRRKRLEELVKLYHEIEWHDDHPLAAGNNMVMDENKKPIIIQTKEIGTAAKILKQIAEEVGDAQARKAVELSGPNGGPIETEEKRKIVFYIPEKEDESTDD
jgi:hypothetical protein